MNPFQKNKVDINSLAPEDRRAFRLYGKLPTKLPATARRVNPSEQRKYFDSGDYALSKAGKAAESVGSQHPDPTKIPHAVRNGGLAIKYPGTAAGVDPQTGSPIKESSVLNHGVSVNEVVGNVQEDQAGDKGDKAKEAISPASQRVTLVSPAQEQVSPTDKAQASSIGNQAGDEGDEGDEAKKAISPASQRVPLVSPAQEQAQASSTGNQADLAEKSSSPREDQPKQSTLPIRT